MFYHTQHLVSRNAKYSLIWKLATTNKRVSRGAICELDITDICLSLQERVPSGKYNKQELGEKFSLYLLGQLAYGVALAFKKQVIFLEEDACHLVATIRTIPLEMRLELDEVLGHRGDKEAKAGKKGKKKNTRDVDLTESTVPLPSVDLVDVIGTVPLEQITLNEPEPCMERTLFGELDELPPMRLEDLEQFGMNLMSQPPLCFSSGESAEQSKQIADLSGIADKRRTIGLGDGMLDALPDMQPGPDFSDNLVDTMNRDLGALPAPGEDMAAQQDPPSEQVRGDVQMEIDQRQPQDATVNAEQLLPAAGEEGPVQADAQAQFPDSLELEQVSLTQVRAEEEANRVQPRREPSRFPVIDEELQLSLEQLKANMASDSDTVRKRGRHELLAPPIKRPRESVAELFQHRPLSSVSRRVLPEFEDLYFWATEECLLTKSWDEEDSELTTSQVNEGTLIDGDLLLDKLDQSLIDTMHAARFDTPLDINENLGHLRGQAAKDLEEAERNARERLEQVDFNADLLGLSRPLDANLLDGTSSLGREATPLFGAGPLGIPAPSVVSAGGSQLGLDVSAADSGVLTANAASEMGGSTTTDSFGFGSLGTSGQAVRARFRAQANIWQTLAELFLSEGRIADVGPCVEQAIALFPSSYQALYLKGRLLNARADKCGPTAATQAEQLRTEAKSCLLSALAIFPNHTDSLAQLASIYKAAGNVSMAEQMYKELVRIDPLWCEYWQELGEVYCRQGQHDRALECFTTASSLDRKLATTNKRVSRGAICELDITDICLSLQERVPSGKYNKQELGEKFSLYLLGQLAYGVALAFKKQVIFLEEDACHLVATIRTIPLEMRLELDEVLGHRGDKEAKAGKKGKKKNTRDVDLTESTVPLPSVDLVDVIGTVPLEQITLNEPEPCMERTLFGELDELPPMRLEDLEQFGMNLMSQPPLCFSSGESAEQSKQIADLSGIADKRRTIGLGDGMLDALPDMQPGPDFSDNLVDTMNRDLGALPAPGEDMAAQQDPPSEQVRGDVQMEIDQRQPQDATVNAEQLLPAAGEEGPVQADAQAQFPDSLELEQVSLTQVRAEEEANRVQPRREPSRFPVIDEELQLSLEQLKANMASDSDTVRKRGRHELLAPPIKRPRESVAELFQHRPLSSVSRRVLPEFEDLYFWATEECLLTKSWDEEDSELTTSQVNEGTLIDGDLLLDKLDQSLIDTMHAARFDTPLDINENLGHLRGQAAKDLEEAERNARERLEQVDFNADLLGLSRPLDANLLDGENQEQRERDLGLNLNLELDLELEERERDREAAEAQRRYSNFTDMSPYPAGRPSGDVELLRDESSSRRSDWRPHHPSNGASQLDYYGGFIDVIRHKLLVSEDGRTLVFDDLVPPETTSKNSAARRFGFLLASMRKGDVVGVEQNEPYGAIRFEPRAVLEEEENQINAA